MSDSADSREVHGLPCNPFSRTTEVVKLHMRGPFSTISSARRIVGIASLSAVLTCTLLLGCQKPLFPPDAPRTQFDAHDTLRNRYVPLEEPDVFGNPQPALRARLSRHR